METRKCITCNRNLPIDQFPLRGRGHSKICRSCTDVQNKKIPIPGCADDISQKLDMQNKSITTLISDKFSSFESYVVTEMNDMRQLVSILSNTINNISNEVSSMSTSISQVQSLISKLDTSDKQLVDNITDILSKQVKDIESIKTNISRINTPICTPTNSPPRSPNKTCKQGSEPDKLTVYDTVFEPEFLSILSDKDLDRYINIANSSYSYYKRSDPTRSEIAKKNTELLRLERRNRK